MPDSLDLSTPVSALPDLRLITITGDKHGWQARDARGILARHESLGGLLATLIESMK